MSIAEFEDYMMITCSPIRKIKGIDTFLANISVVHDDFGATFCRIQLTQRHLSYNEGFSDEEISELFVKVIGLESELLEEARKTNPRDGAPDGDVEILE